MDRRNEWWNASTSVVTAPEPDPAPGAGMDAWRSELDAAQAAGVRLVIIDDDQDEDPCDHRWQCPTCYGDPDCEHDTVTCQHCGLLTILDECSECGWEPDCRTGHRDMACTECNAPYPQ